MRILRHTSLYEQLCLMSRKLVFLFLSLPEDSKSEAPPKKKKKKELTFLLTLGRIFSSLFFSLNLYSIFCKDYKLF